MSYNQRKQELINQFHQAKGPVLLKKNTSNLFRGRKGLKQKIDVRALNHVLKIDRENRTVEVEGMTTYETLLRETLNHSLMPAVVPELKSITIGGAFAGVGIETSSFKYGFVHETFLEIEVLLPNGKIVTASPNEASDLFYGFPNTYGTLGYVLKARIMLFPAKKYVKIVRQKYIDTRKFLADMAELGAGQRTGKQWDFIEGVVFDERENILTLAKFVDQAQHVSDYTHMSIYYKSIATKSEDYLTTFDYLFRYDTDWFWGSKYLGLENRFFRKLVGRRNLHSAKYYKAMQWERKLKLLAAWNTLTGNRTESLIQDAEVPAPQAEEFIGWFHKHIGMKPFLVAPVQTFRDDARFTLSPIEPGVQYMNIGFYSPLPTRKPDGYYNRLIEQKILQMKVKKLLYSRCLFSQKEFWEMVDEREYNRLKEKYDPKHLAPTLYEKCTGQK